MDCKEFREALDLFVDGELAPEATSAAQLHDQECASCHRAFVALLRLRQQMKAAAAQHQPPAELVNAVQRISQPRWKRLLGISDGGPTPGISRQSSFSVSRYSITVPLPVFALLLIAVALGAWSASWRIAKRSSLMSRTPTAPAIKVVGESPSGDAINFSRFDRGERISIYKTRR